MPDSKEQEPPRWGHFVPHVLVVDRDSEYGHQLASTLRGLSVRVKQTETVDAFLDMNCMERVDLVLMEIDPMDPDALENIQLLRTHFGEGSGTRIVASSDFTPGAFPTLVEQRGADVFLAKNGDPDGMAVSIANEIHKQLKTRLSGSANAPRRKA